VPVARLLLLVRVAPPYAPVAQATRPAGRCSVQEDARGRGCLGPGCLPGWPRRGRRRLDEVAGTWWPARGGRPSCTVTVAVLLLLGGPVRIGCLGRGPCTARPTQNMGRRHRTVFSVTVDDEDEDDDETARGRRERQVA